jgi:hypothetical protein
MTTPIPPSTAVEARFYVASTTEQGQPTDKGCKGQVKLSAVSRGDQNRQWASATPCGSLDMTILNPAAFEEVRSWQRAGWDVQVVLKPVRVLKPEDGHFFRQATHDDPTDYYAREGLCGDCGYMLDQHVDQP